MIGALKELERNDQVGFGELYEQIVLENKIFEGEEGYLQSTEDYWGTRFLAESELTGGASNDFEMFLGIPEPTSIVLLVLGVTVMVTRRRY